MQRERALAVSGVAIFAVVAGFSACGGGADTNAEPPSIDAAQETEVAVVSETEDTYEDLSFDFATDVTWDVGPEPVPPDAGADPVVACGPDTGVGDGGDCPLPPSRCVDSRWLVSYVNGTCVDGTCKWWPIFHDCSAEGASTCFSGACRFAIGK